MFMVLNQMTEKIKMQMKNNRKFAENQSIHSYMAFALIRYEWIKMYAPIFKLTVSMQRKSG